MAARRAGVRGRGLRGSTLIELLVGITILAVLLAMGAPSFAEWMLNTRVRTTAESMQAGLQMARAEAVRRNVPVRFQLTTSVDNTCALSTTGTYWVVNVGAATSPSGACGNAPSDTVAPTIVQTSPRGGSVTNVSVSAGVSAIGFNGLGRLVAIGGVAPADLIVNVGSSQGTCVSAGGAVRCLRLQVSTAGQIRLCDPARQATGDPMKC